MRKVLVFGTTVVTGFSLSAAVGPVGAETKPRPARSAPAPVPQRGGITASAVMVTPTPPDSDTYAYGEGSRRQLDAYWREPAGKTAKRPGVLFLHGGYWMAGDKRAWRYAARKITTRGYVVFSANYRLIPRAVWPAQRNDVEAALAFIKRNARRWNLDPNRIVVVGSSAGGHLATQLGTFGDGARRVRGVVALSPVVSLLLAYQDGAAPTADHARRKLRQAATMLVGCKDPIGNPTCAERMRDASSTTHAGPGDAPMLLMHSQNEFVPVTHSTGLADALQASGVPATVRALPGDAHGGALLKDESTFTTVMAWVDSVAKS